MEAGGWGVWLSQVLLCKRAIEPCEGKWGIPQGTVRAETATLIMSYTATC